MGFLCLQLFVELLAFLVFFREEGDGPTTGAPFDILTEEDIGREEDSNQDDGDTPIAPQLIGSVREGGLDVI